MRDECLVRYTRAMTRGERIRQRRLQSQMTQQQLADAAGVSRLTVLKTENDSSEPLAQTIEALADALGVSVEDLRATR